MPLGWSRLETTGKKAALQERTWKNGQTTSPGASSASVQRPATSRNAGSRAGEGSCISARSWDRLELGPVWAPQHTRDSSVEAIRMVWAGACVQGEAESARFVQPGEKAKGRSYVFCYSLMGSHREAHRKSWEATSTGTTRKVLMRCKKSFHCQHGDTLE